MGFFSKPEVIVKKESNRAKEYVSELECLLPKASGEIKEQIQKEIMIAKSGIAGEEKVLFELKNSGMDMVVLQDLYIETEDGRGAQIDFVVITPKINFLIECKNLFGDIEINSKGDFIRTMQYGNRRYKEGIYSPITQNERHMEILKECKAEQKNFIQAAVVRKSFSSFYKSLVVLANPKTVLNDRYAKREVKEKVIRADQLNATIKKIVSESKELASSKKEMIKMADRLLELQKDASKEYSEKYKELVTEMGPTINHEEENKNICPWCGGNLILRTAKKGKYEGNQFYGCEKFPKCRYMRNIKRKEDEK